MRIPRAQVPVRHEIVLVQPGVQLNVLPDLKLPEVFAWSRHEPGTPAALIIPGHSESGTGRPVAEPTLTTANAQPRIGQLNVAPVPAPLPAVLSVPPQATTPISFPAQAGSDSDTRISVDTRDADPVNLLASSARHPSPGELVRIPSGTAVPAGAAPDGTAGSAQSRKLPGGAPETSLRSGSDSERVQTGVRQEGLQTGGRIRTGTDPAGGRPLGEAATAMSAATGAGHGLQEPGDRGSTPQEAPLRKVHPKNGNFDVVITQAPRSGNSRESEAALTGSQVYTVYLEVGTERPWMLQFCKPADPGANRLRGGVLQLTAATRIQPPYPVVTVVPPPGSAVTAEKLYVRGILTGEGRLEQVALVGETDPAARQILRLLQQWQFKPAMENGIPVRVEVLLTIPPEART